MSGETWHENGKACVDRQCYMRMSSDQASFCSASDAWAGVSRVQQVSGNELSQPLPPAIVFSHKFVTDRTRFCRSSSVQAVALLPLGKRALGESDTASSTRLAEVAVKVVIGVYLAQMPQLTAHRARLKRDHASFGLAYVTRVGVGPFLGLWQGVPFVVCN